MSAAPFRNITCFIAATYGMFTFFKEDPTIYAHTRLCPVILGVTVKQNQSHMELPLCWGVLFSAVVKSLSEKSLLHKYLLRSILAETVVQHIPTFLAHTTAL
jgi:hypothetical protein